MKKHVSICVCSVALALLASSGLVQAREQTFARPAINGVRLDWCYHWGTECGKPAADAFCRQQGYDHATGFKQLSDVPPSYVLGDRKTCNSPICDTIVDLTCAKDARTFARPAIDGVRLDWCYHWGQECGKPAADAFCRQHGYSHATGFQKLSDVPPSYVLGDRKTCNSPTCDTIVDLTCAP